MFSIGFPLLSNRKMKRKEVGTEFKCRNCKFKGKSRSGLARHSKYHCAVGGVTCRRAVGVAKKPFVQADYDGEEEEGVK